MIHEGILPLWTDLLYGGHPYFAEAQGGFLNPLNFVVALFFEPIAGQNIYNWLSIIIGALGMYLLCRHLSCSREASTFGVLAVVFSSYWIQSHNNITISGALCWIPWVFLCVERWIESPAGTSAIWLAISVSLLIFSGYPQAFHGAIIYMVVSLIPTLSSGYIGSRTNNSLWQYLVSGLTAIAVCIGLSAVQWLPMLELTTWSCRSGGADIMIRVPLSMYLCGFLFTYFDSDVSNLCFGTLGSVFVCFVASLALILKRNHRTIGHMIAVVFLIILGLEYATPVFRYMLKYQIVPGLKYFRIVHLYMGISIIGIGLLSGIAIDNIQRQYGRLENRMQEKLTFFFCGSVLFLIWAGLALWLKLDGFAMITFVSLIAAYIMLMAFMYFNKSKWFGHAVLILIVIEIVFLRISPAPFVDPKQLEKPRLAEHIQADVRNKGYKLMDISDSGSIGFMYPWSPNLTHENRNFISKLCASSNVLWNIPSIDAALALPLARLRLIQPEMKSEILGTISTLPGIRFIDYLGVRYISTNEIYQTVGLEPLIRDGITVLENKLALPRVQTFTRYEMANSADNALRRLKQSQKATLILEPPFNKAAGTKGLPASTVFNEVNALNILSAKLTNDRYRFEVNAAQPAWLFIADANYPGWQARIDGQSTPVYSAQVLGKAILVPFGNHKITIEYKPRSFAIGLYLLLMTLFVLLVIGIRRIYPAKSLFRKQVAHR